MSALWRLFGGAALAVVATFAWSTPPAAAHPSIDIVASNWKFTPSTITAHLNEPTTLRLTSSEGVHGIQSSELGIPNTTILPGKFVTVTFTPTKTGTYFVHCSVFCGAGHVNMVLTVKVVP
jgi:cytochrome c oxidase subunit 2